MLVWCEGGPALARAVVYPPPHEIEIPEGLYVLIDDGPPESWYYEFAG